MNMPKNWVFPLSFEFFLEFWGINLEFNFSRMSPEATEPINDENKEESAKDIDYLLEKIIGPAGK